MKPYRIAIYIRVSTEEQAENPEGSIRNQEQRLRDYVKLKNADGVFGEIAEVFCDAGIAAKDMNRPSLQRMLALVRSGEINLVLVTEISRLTRATKDFALLWDFLKEHGCQFQSLRDNFGGLWNGGVIPLGYELNPNRQGHLQIVESEAEIVRKVFKTFFEWETLSRTGHALNDQKITMPKKPRNGGSFRSFSSCN